MAPAVRDEPGEDEHRLVSSQARHPGQHRRLVPPERREHAVVQPAHHRVEAPEEWTVGRKAGIGSESIDQGSSGSPQPRRDVPFRTEQAPDIDVVVAFHVEQQIRTTLQGLSPQAGEIQLVGMARRTRRRMAGDVRARTLERIDEAERDPLAGLAQIVLDSLVGIAVRPFPQNDPFAAHAVVCRRTRSRRRSKRAPSAVDAGAESAPSSSRPRRR